MRNGDVRTGDFLIADWKELEKDVAMFLSTDSDPDKYMLTFAEELASSRVHSARSNNRDTSHLVLTAFDLNKIRLREETPTLKDILPPVREETLSQKKNDFWRRLKLPNAELYRRKTISGALHTCFSLTVINMRERPHRMHYAFEQQKCLLEAGITSQKRGYHSMYHCGVLDTPTPILKAMRIPATKVAVDKAWDKHNNLPARSQSKVRAQADVTHEAQNKKTRRHFATLMFSCHLKQSELAEHAKKQKTSRASKGQCHTRHKMTSSLY